MTIADLLTGGDPRSLHNVDRVVAALLAERGLLPELIGCVSSDDPIVRMRAADALEKVSRARPHAVEPHLDRLFAEMGGSDQPSVQWHLAQILSEVRLTASQRSRAVELVWRYLDHSDDWIVLNCSLVTMAGFARHDPALVPELIERLRSFETSRYRSLASRSRKLLAEFQRTPHSHMP
jgi:hypothetical protein